MTTSPRRRVLRPARTSADDSNRQRVLHKKRTRLHDEQQSLLRWMSRLKRAFHAVEKQQRTIARLERELARLESR
jgi:hypothetical protein